MNLLKVNNFFSLEKLTIQTLLRIIFIIVIFIFDFLSEASNDRYSFIIKISFILFTIVVSVSFVLLIKFYKKKFLLLYLQIFIDLILTTGIIFIIQKTNFLITFLYLLSITNAAIVLFRKGAFIAAISSSILTVFVYKLMFSLNILKVDSYDLLKISIFNLIIYFAYAIIITVLTESLIIKDSLLYAKEIELNAQKKIKNAVIDNMYSGVIVIDEEMRIIFLNKNAENILEIKGHDFYGLNINELLTELQYLKVGDKEEIKYNEKMIGLTITKLKDIENNISGFMLIFKDITEKLKLEKSIKRNEKLAYIGEISASIAHEIRNPLASISASLQMMPRFINKDPAKIEKLTAIGLKEITRLNNLITDFLDYARMDKLDLENINLVDILEDIRDLYELSSVKYLIIKYNDIEKISIVGDKDKLKQVFINLVKNAIEAMEKTKNKEILIDCKENNDEYIIVITDTGTGMSDEVIKDIFNPFFTTKKTGTGLGLSLINKFISLHNGRIDVKSIIDEGTEFIVYLPKPCAELDSVLNS